MPSEVVVNSLMAMTPALLIRISILGIVSSLRMVLAAVRTEVWEVRSRGTNLTAMEELVWWMLSMTGWILARERPRRRSVWGGGLELAREVAVPAPSPPVEGPVIATIF